MADVFGEIRSIAQGPPSEAAWWRLTRLCDRVPPARLGELIPYMDASLRAWPDRARLAPRRWIEQAMTGAHTPQLALTRHLHLLEPLPLTERPSGRPLLTPFEHMATHHALSPVVPFMRIPEVHASLDVICDAAGGWSWTWITTDRIDALHTREEAQQLVGLRVIQWRELIGEHVLGLLQRLDPERVALLELPMLGADEGALRHLRGRVWPRLRALDLGMKSADPELCEGWQDVADTLPALEYLSLDASYSTDTGAEDEQARVDWLATARMPQHLRGLDLGSALLYIADEDEGIAESLGLIPWLGQIDALSLREHPISAETLRWLADRHHLRALSLEGEICFPLPDLIAQTLAALPLRALEWSIAHPTLGATTSAMLAPTVEALCLTQPLDATAAAALGPDLAARPLRELKLSCAGDALDALRPLGASKTLRALSLDPAQWADGDDLRLAAIAATDAPLRHVGLRQCGDEALRALARSGVSSIELYKRPEDPQATQDLASRLDVEVWW